MRASGIAEEERELSMAIEWYLRDLVGVWQRDAATTGDIEGVAAWAARLLSVEDFSQTRTQFELESQVRALCQLSGLDYDQASRQVERIWLTSPAGSAARRESSRSSYPTQDQCILRTSRFSTPVVGSQAASGRTPRGASNQSRGTPPRPPRETLGEQPGRPAVQYPSSLARQ